VKKLLFVLAFTFIGQQAFSQIYIVTISSSIQGTSCPNLILTITDPTGAQTYVCVDESIHDGALGQLNQELNNIASLGYKLFETSYNSDHEGLIKIDYSTGPSGSWDKLNEGVSFIFAIP
jgi:hypothetical protein